MGGEASTCPFPAGKTRVTASLTRRRERMARTPMARTAFPRLSPAHARNPVGFPVRTGGAESNLPVSSAFSHFGPLQWADRGQTNEKKLKFITCASSIHTGAPTEQSGEVRTCNKNIPFQRRDKARKSNLSFWGQQTVGR